MTTPDEPAAGPDPAAVAAAFERARLATHDAARAAAASPAPLPPAQLALLLGDLAQLATECGQASRTIAGLLRAAAGDRDVTYLHEQGGDAQVALRAAGQELGLAAAAFADARERTGAAHDQVSSVSIVR